MELQTGLIIKNDDTIANIVCSDLMSSNNALLQVKVGKEGESETLSFNIDSNTWEIISKMVEMIKIQKSFDWSKCSSNDFTIVDNLKGNASFPYTQTSATIEKK